MTGNEAATADLQTSLHKTVKKFTDENFIDHDSLGKVITIYDRMRDSNNIKQLLDSSIFFYGEKFLDSLQETYKKELRNETYLICFSAIIDRFQLNTRDRDFREKIYAQLLKLNVLNLTLKFLRLLAEKDYELGLVYLLGYCNDDLSKNDAFSEVFETIIFSFATADCDDVTTLNKIISTLVAKKNYNLHLVKLFLNKVQPTNYMRAHSGVIADSIINFMIIFGWEEMKEYVISHGTLSGNPFDLIKVIVNKE